MDWWRFVLANAAGGILWAGIYTLASYLAGDALLRNSGTISWILGGAAVVAIVVGLIAVRRQAARLGDRAEAAYPGPLESAGNRSR
jgi:membrane protein DedA with SNARE-associated domain